MTSLARKPPQRVGAEGASLAAGEFHLGRDDFRRIADMIYQDAGIDLQESKAPLVYARLAKRMRALGLEAFAEYCALVGGPGGAEERKQMLSALTTNVTRFFREPHHFEHLKTKVLPALISAAAKGGRIRIWSAACSTGQEPYSIALTILSLWPEAVRHDVKVLATDIDPNVIATAEAGLYAEPQLEGIPPDMRKRFLEPEPGDAEPRWRVGEAARSLVTFRPLNLIGEWPMRGVFQAIFCRNVVIYFDEPTQQRLWQKFVPRLDHGGYLYIGHSERVSGPASTRLQSDGISTYRQVGEDRS